MLRKIRDWLRPPEKIKKRRLKARGFQAANYGRLFGSWTMENTTLDYELKNGLKSIRARSRDLSLNNDYYRKYLQLICTNVVGHGGIKMQARVVDFAPGGVTVPDKLANLKIEQAWAKWGRRGSCDVTGKMSWCDLQELVAETVARDGEILVRKLRGKQYKHGIALQCFEADYLDEGYNETLRNGNKIIMGVEVNTVGRPVFYHLSQVHPGDETYYNVARNKNYIKVPANEIEHLYLVERTSQTRGYPWGVSAMTRLKNLEGYEEAALTAARVGAAKMGFYTTPDGQYQGDDIDGVTPISEIEPGLLEVLPQGYDFKSFDPDYPHQQFDAFMSRTLKGIASGLGIPYPALASDLNGVSYSSIRYGELEVRDFWRTTQRWMIDAFCQPIFEAWLSSALLTADLALPPEKFEKFNSVQWVPRSWDWVDPLKDVKATVAALDAGLTSKAQVIAEMGGDYVETQDQLAAEMEYEQMLGIWKQPKDTVVMDGQEDTQEEEDTTNEDENGST